MGMQNINGRSPYLRPDLMDQVQANKKKMEENKQPSLASQNAALQGPNTDQADISDTAHKLVDLRAAVDVGRAALAELPEVRADKVSLAKERLEQGYYQSPVVQDKMSGLLLNVLGKIDEL